MGYADTITLQKVCDRYGKGKFVQMEALSYTHQLKKLNVPQNEKMS